MVYDELIRKEWLEMRAESTEVHGVVDHGWIGE